MKQSQLKWDDLCQAYWQGSWQNRYYLDQQSGEVVSITEQLRSELQSIYDKVGEDSADVLIDSAELALAHAVEIDDERYLKIIEWRNFWEEADQFAASVSPPFQRLLWQTLDLQNRAAFEQMLQLEPLVAARWQQFKRECAIAQLKNWLDELRLKSADSTI